MNTSNLDPELSAHVARQGRASRNLNLGVGALVTALATSAATAFAGAAVSSGSPQRAAWIALTAAGVGLVGAAVVWVRLRSSQRRHQDLERVLNEAPSEVRQVVVKTRWLAVRGPAATQGAGLRYAELRLGNGAMVELPLGYGAPGHAQELRLAELLQQRLPRATFGLTEDQMRASPELEAVARMVGQEKLEQFMRERRRT